MPAAADALFADTDAPHTVSVDDIAAAVGIGKETLFRAFGSRDNLLDNLFANAWLLAWQNTIKTTTSSDCRGGSVRVCTGVPHSRRQPQHQIPDNVSEFL